MRVSRCDHGGHRPAFGFQCRLIRGHHVAGSSIDLVVQMNSVVRDGIRALCRLVVGRRRYQGRRLGTVRRGGALAVETEELVAAVLESEPLHAVPVRPTTAARATRAHTFSFIDPPRFRQAHISPNATRLVATRSRMHTYRCIAGRREPTGPYRHKS